LDGSLEVVSPRAVCATIASAVIGTGQCHHRIGNIRLRPEQLDAIHQIEKAIANCGGALLCDEVGLGKTYTAIAFISRAKALLVIAPSAILEMWRTALAAAGTSATLISVERFSRSKQNVGAPDIVVIDEAHHLRNPRTNRFKNIARLCKSVPVLLLTATPIHNNPADLSTLLSLFLGSRARSLTQSERATCVIRRTHAFVGTRDVPSRVFQRPITISAEARILDKIVSLPPPIPARDGGEAATLITYSLLRQWVSSDAAADAAICRRIARSLAIESALESGKYPSRAELGAWLGNTSQVIQLGFPEFLVEKPGANELLEVVRAHILVLRDLLKLLRDSKSRDDLRCDFLRDIRAAHPGEKIVAFSQFFETVDSLFRRLRSTAEIALVSSRSARIASGGATRSEVLRRFAPIAHGAPAPHPRENVSMLLTTDLCSEGLNLQDASVVVHLDLPWTAAKLEQRIGRVARLNSHHATCTIYRFDVPQAADMMLQMETRIRRKLGFSSREIGTQQSPLGLPVGNHTSASPDQRQEVLRILAMWLSETEGVSNNRDVKVGFARSRTNGFLALVSLDAPTLVGRLAGSEVSDNPATILDIVRAAIIEPGATSLETAGNSLAAVQEWLVQKKLEQSLAIQTIRVSPARRLAVRRLRRAVTRVTRANRGRVAQLASTAASIASAHLSAGDEGQLQELSLAQTNDELWLNDVAELANRSRGTRSSRGETMGVTALLVLVADP
jgi:superfamily II DNA or RNA helicase